jgi:hypothetical protein
VKKAGCRGILKCHLNQIVSVGATNPGKVQAYEISLAASAK